MENTYQVNCNFQVLLKSCSWEIIFFYSTLLNKSWISMLVSYQSFVSVSDKYKEIKHLTCNISSVITAQNISFLNHKKKRLSSFQIDKLFYGKSQLINTQIINTGVQMPFFFLKVEFVHSNANTNISSRPV